MGNSETDNPYDPNDEADDHASWNDGYASVAEEEM